MIYPEFDDDDIEEIEFIPCDKCDGHPACEDFGCAIKLGVHLTKNKTEPGVDDWS